MSRSFIGTSSSSIPWQEVLKMQGIVFFYQNLVDMSRTIWLDYLLIAWKVTLCWTFFVIKIACYKKIIDVKTKLYNIFHQAKQISFELEIYFGVMDLLESNFRFNKKFISINIGSLFLKSLRPLKRLHINWLKIVMFSIIFFINCAYKWTANEPQTDVTRTKFVCSVSSGREKGLVNQFLGGLIPPLFPTHHFSKNVLSPLLKKKGISNTYEIIVVLIRHTFSHNCGFKN